MFSKQWLGYVYTKYHVGNYPLPDVYLKYTALRRSFFLSVRICLPVYSLSRPRIQFSLLYEGESVNRIQKDIKRETGDIRTWKEKHLFLDMSSTNTDTLVPSLYLCVENRSIKVFWLMSQLFAHSCFNLFVINETFAAQLWTALRDKHFPQ
jgi:hypothetical protein